MYRNNNFAFNAVAKEKLKKEKKRRGMCTLVASTDIIEKRLKWARHDSYSGCNMITTLFAT